MGRAAYGDSKACDNQGLMAVGRGDKVIGNGIKGLGSWGVMRVVLWVLNSPKEKGRLKGLVRLAGAIYSEAEERSSTQWCGFAWATRS